jgi:hypothetical protein
VPWDGLALFEAERVLVGGGVMVLVAVVVPVAVLLICWLWVIDVVTDISCVFDIVSDGVRVLVGGGVMEAVLVVEACTVAEVAGTPVRVGNADSVAVARRVRVGVWVGVGGGVMVFDGVPVIGSGRVLDVCVAVDSSDVVRLREGVVEEVSVSADDDAGVGEGEIDLCVGDPVGVEATDSVSVDVRDRMRVEVGVPDSTMVIVGREFRVGLLVPVKTPEMVTFSLPDSRVFEADDDTEYVAVIVSSPVKVLVRTRRGVTVMSSVDVFVTVMLELLDGVAVREALVAVLVNTSGVLVMAKVKVVVLDGARIGVIVVVSLTAPLKLEVEVRVEFSVDVAVPVGTGSTLMVRVSDTVAVRRCVTEPSLRLFVAVSSAVFVKLAEGELLNVIVMVSDANPVVVLEALKVSFDVFENVFVVVMETVLE